MDGTDVQEQDAQVTETSNQVDETSDANLEELDGAALMEAFLSDPSHGYKTLKYGDVLEGTIMHVDRDELLVDIGSKAEGIVPSKEYSSLSSEEKEAIQIGDTLLVFVVQAENNEGHPVVSIDRAKQEKSWRKLQEIHEANDVIEAEVVNYNKGGLLVNLDGVRGFVPASQVSEIRGGDESSKQADMARLIGTKLPLKVIEINRHRNRLILSERQAVQERRDAMKESLIQELTEGEVRTGRVSSICDFGAFVDIGGADGLVHLSELSWSRVRHPNELLKIGQEVQVYVLGINPTEKKIALSIKRTQAEPWSRVENSYEVGQLVRGTVTQLANFGAFARIEDGIEGLIHVSELADERIQHPKQVVQEGQDLLLRIIRIDPQRRRMGLSLRRALDTPDADLEAVFGEGIIEERDALQVTIKAALEAEGLLGTRQDEVADREAPSGETSGTTNPEEAIKEAGEAQVAAFEERAARAERANKQRAARGRKKDDAVDANQTYGDDSGMSAMELAFAKLGTDLLDEEAAGTATKAAAPVEAEVEAPAEVEAEVETPIEAEVEAEAPVEADVETPVETEAEVEAPAETEAEAEAEAPAETEAETAVETEGEEKE